MNKCMVLTTRPVSTQLYAYCEEKALMCDNQIDCGHQQKPHNKFTYIYIYSIKRYVYTKVSIAQQMQSHIEVSHFRKLSCCFHAAVSSNQFIAFLYISSIFIMLTSSLSST